MSDQQPRQLATPWEAFQVVTDVLERSLRAKHPRLTAYLELTILVRKLWGGGFDVMGTIYASEHEAIEAQRAAIMHKLIAAESKPPCEQA